jgi:hypothetical protein
MFYRIIFKIDSVVSDFSDSCPEAVPKSFSANAAQVTFAKQRSYSDYFYKCWTNNLKQLLVVETNRYGRTKYGDNWIDTTESELNGFLGTTMLMSLIVLPSIRDYWTHDNLFGQRQIKKTFKRERYKRLLGCLHLANNEATTNDRNSDDYDKLHHIRPMINIINHNFQHNFNFGCQGTDL